MPNTSISSSRHREYYPLIMAESPFQKSGTIKHSIIAIETQNRNAINYTVPTASRLNIPFLSWFKGVSSITPGERYQSHDSYPTDSFLQQRDEVAAELNHRLAPSIELPFSLKRNKRLAIGVGLLAGAGNSSLALGLNAGYKTLAREGEQLPLSIAPLTLHHNKTEVFTDAPSISAISQNDELISPLSHPSKKKAIQPAGKSVVRQKRLIRFLRKNNVLHDCIQAHKLPKETLIEAVAQYLYEDSQSGEIRQVKLARVILRTEHLYGGRKEDALSSQQSQKVISRWLFDHIIGTTPAEYVAKKILRAEYPLYFTINSLKHLLSLHSVFKDNLLNYSAISTNAWGNFNRLWCDSVTYEMPLIKLPGEMIDNILLNSQAFTELYTGSALLNHSHNLHKFSIDEIRQVGNELWNIAISEGFDIDSIDFFLLPVLTIAASNKKEVLTKKNNRLHIYISAIDDYLDENRQALALETELIHQFSDYKRRANDWLSKEELADTIIKKCRFKHSQNDYRRQYYIKQEYLNDFNKPCRRAPDHLDEEYIKITKRVTDSYFEFDKTSITLALSHADINDKNFIYSHEAKINPVNFHIILIHPIYYNTNKSIHALMLLNTDLFAITLKGEERIYALKNTKNSATPMYQLIRVDRNIRKYIDNNLIDFEYLPKDYSVINDLVIAGDRYSFSISTQTHEIDTPQNEKHVLAHYLATIHKTTLHNTLYAKGNDKSDLQQIGSVAKHFIPFYDCIDDSVAGKIAEAVPACIIDIISLIPTAALIARMGIAFSTGVTQGIYSGGITLGKSTLKHAALDFAKEVTLPSASQFIQLGKSTLRFIDPGFELISNGAKLLGKKVTAQLFKTPQGASLAEKIAIHQDVLNKLPSPKDYSMAQLPDSTIKVPVTRVTTKHQQDIYVMVNPDTGELFGRYYKLTDKNQLKPIKKSIYRQKTPRKVSKVPPTPVQHPAPLAIDDHPLSISRIPPQNTFITPFYYVPAHVQLAGIPHVDLSVQPHISLDFSHDAIQIKNFIVESYAQDDVFLCRFNQQQWEIPAAFATLRNNLEKYKSEIELAKSQVNKLHHEILSTTLRNDDNVLNFPAVGHRITAYLSKVLHLNTLNDASLVRTIQTEALSRLAFHTEKIREYLNHEVNNIYFVSSDTAAHPYDISCNTPVGFVYNTDHFRRVFIMVDSFQPHLASSIKPHLTALHEISHFSGTNDFQVSPIGSLEGDASVLMTSLLEGLYGSKNEFFSLPDGFFEAYHRMYSDRLVDKTELIELIKVDPVLRANVFMDNADFVARMIADLGSRTQPKRSRLGRSQREPQLHHIDIMRILAELLFRRS